jgi:hypothetical protein
VGGKGCRDLLMCAVTPHTHTHTRATTPPATHPTGIQFDQNDLAVRLGSIQLMEAGQPLPFDKAAANKYLKDTCGVHGTVNIYVAIGKGPGSGGCIVWVGGWGLRGWATLGSCWLAECSALLGAKTLPTMTPILCPPFQFHSHLARHGLGL